MLCYNVRMNDTNLTITIGHVYPNLLDGDICNLIVLKQRCLWRGINVEISKINVGDNFNDYDMYFLGSAQDQQQDEAAKALYLYREELKEKRDNGTVFLGIGAGYQMLGNYYQQQGDVKIMGVSLLDAFTALLKNKRFSGNVTAKVDFLNPNTLVGFENHRGLTYIEGETKPLATVSKGCGNNGKDGFEGARYKNVFGTYLQGSLFAENVHFADYIIELALEKHYGKKIHLSDLNDNLEMEAHNSLINKVYK